MSGLGAVATVMSEGRRAAGRSSWADGNGGRLVSNALRLNADMLLPTPSTPADSFPFKWINKKWKEGFFGASAR